jgi:hypothetical protein
MAIFGGTKNYASIVAPLKKMVTDLTSYIESYNQANVLDNEEITRRQTLIADRTTENNKSNFTIGKINDLLGSDLDEDKNADDGTATPIE